MRHLLVSNANPSPCACASSDGLIVSALSRELTLFFLRSASLCFPRPSVRTNADEILPNPFPFLPAENLGKSHVWSVFSKAVREPLRSTLGFCSPFFPPVFSLTVMWPPLALLANLYSEQPYGAFNNWRNSVVSSSWTFIHTFLPKTARFSFRALHFLGSSFVHNSVTPLLTFCFPSAVLSFIPVLVPSETEHDNCGLNYWAVFVMSNVLKTFDFKFRKCRLRWYFEIL